MMNCIWRFKLEVTNFCKEKIILVHWLDKSARVFEARPIYNYKEGRRTVHNWLSTMIISQPWLKNFLNILYLYTSMWNIFSIRLGYEGIFVKRTFDKNDEGCATFYKTCKFVLQDNMTYLLGDIAAKVC